MNLTDKPINGTNPLNRSGCVFPGCPTPLELPYPVYGFNLCIEHQRQWQDQMNTWEIWQRRMESWLEKAKKSEAA
jgi:hypothetical protein